VGHAADPAVPGRRLRRERWEDFQFVEAHTVGQDDWTTLPDQNGHTDQNTGESCPEGWHTDPSDEIHPFLAHYQTFNGAGVYFGFGLEGVTSADQRNAVMGRALDILLAP